MISVDQVLADFFRREGWPIVTDHPADRGRLTKGGITFASFNRWRDKWGERALTPDEFRLITQEEARAFLTDEFLRKLDFIDDEGIFALLVDWAMHAGVDDPTRALQGELKARGLYGGTIDGIPGAETRAAWAMVRRDLAACAEIESTLVKARIAFHLDRAFDADVRAYVKAHPTSQLAFLRGWLNRALEFV